MQLVFTLLFILMLGGVSAVLYHYQTQPADLQLRWQDGLISASWLFAALCMAQFWRQLKRGALVWDGFSWTWTSNILDEAQAKPSSQTGSVSVRFDGQRCLLLKLEPISKTGSEAGRAQWFWLDQAFAPEQWHELRLAVYSRAKEPIFNTHH